MNRSNFRELGGKGNYRTYPNIKKSLVFIQVHYSRLLTALLTLWSWQFDQTANTEGGSKKKSVLIGSSLGFPAGISTEGGSANVALGDQTQKVLLLLPVFFFFLPCWFFIYLFFSCGLSCLADFAIRIVIWMYSGERTALLHVNYIICGLVWQCRGKTGGGWMHNCRTCKTQKTKQTYRTWNTKMRKYTDT